MRLLDRNKRPFWYCLYQGGQTVIDEDGNDTGVPCESYAEPVRAEGNVTAASGSAELEQFGIGQAYDKVIQLAGTDWPITESTLLYVDKEPPADFDPDSVDADYAVARVSKFLNQTSIAIKQARDG